MAGSGRESTFDPRAPSVQKTALPGLPVRGYHAAMTEPTPLPSHADVVVVGAGFAGLATARELARAGLDVVVLEAEAIPGFHSSGRNAAIARRLIEEPAVAALAARGMELLERLPSEVPLFARTGGLLVGDDALLSRLASVAAAIPIEAQRLGPDDLLRRVPALAGAELVSEGREAAARGLVGGLFVPDDGVVDIHALLSALLAPVRARTHFSTPVTALERDASSGRSPRISAVVTPRGRIATSSVVNAAGFRANAIAALAGLPPFPFEPVRRHLFVTAPTDLVPRGAPWVWDGTSGWYFRPEGAGLLMCACDATRWHDDQPADPPVDPGAKDALAEKFHRAVPGLRDARPMRGWAGLRILTPDERFVIGADPRAPGFTWVAGLGGHGMTTSCAVGELGALAARGEPLPEPFARAFDPLRFAK